MAVEAVCHLDNDAHLTANQPAITTYIMISFMHKLPDEESDEQQLHVLYPQEQTARRPALQKKMPASQQCD
eukprot:scaffold610700_cov53-Prasinocladus_malaysianus.AAC.1